MGGVFEEPELLLQEVSWKYEARWVVVDDYRWSGPGDDYHVRGSGGLAKQEESPGW